MFLWLLVIFMILPNVSAGYINHSSTLSDLFDDGSEMNARIISEFLSNPRCLSMCNNWSKGEVAKEF